MPKVTWRSPPKINYLAALFSAYRKERNMTSEDIAKKIGCTAQNVRVQLNKPAEDWNIKRLKQYCAVLNIPLEEALMAAAGKPRQ